ncbi:MAG: phospholipase D family protein [Flavobacteriales bacterium]|nr:phospholipase D family protein [Flavobacteriales bacterium]
MSKSILRLQDPTDPDSAYLLETLLERAVAARYGGAAFAWATEAGVRLLLRDEVFERFLKKYPFELIVGADTTTTPEALVALQAAEHDLKGLSVRVFISQTPASLFHPKMTWFGERDGGSLVVGSGNLTSAGLRQNWEAYALCPLNVSETADLKSQWDTWITTHSLRLHSLNSVEAIARVELNRGGWGGRKRVAPVVTTVVDVQDTPILIAEIPKSGDRWKQANFDQDNYENYFGAKVGTQRRMLFQWLRPDGTLADVESRPSVQVISSNWRFELNAAAGLDYPSTGKPIGVFLRVAERTFLYALSMPGDGHNVQLSAFLGSRWTGSASNMKRLRFSLADVGNLSIIQQLLATVPQAFKDEEFE